MKKYFLSAIVLLSGFISQGQSAESVVKYHPSQASDFLILDNANDDVSYWQVNVSYQSSPGEFEPITEIIIEDSYFTQFDHDWVDSDYYYEVIGMDARGNVIIQEGPYKACDNCSSRYEACNWTCVGATYAYTIYLMVDEYGNNGELFVEPAYDGSTYYYEYMSETQFQAMELNPSLFAHYNIGYNGNINDYAGTIIQLNNVTSGTYSNAQGASITSSTVYGIRKHLGIWIPYYANMTSGALASGTPNCNQNFAWALSHIDVPSGSPALACSGSSFGDSDPISGTTYAQAFEYDCSYIVATDVQDEFGNWYTIITQLGCDLSTDPTQPSFGWPSEVSSVTFSEYGNPDGEDIILRKENLFDEDGQFIGLPIEFSAGLYSMSIQFIDASVSTLFFSREESGSYEVSQSDLMGYNAFPVPIEGQTFNLTFDASAYLEFEYTLTSSRGILLHTETFSVEQDEIKTVEISVEPFIPRGLLFNTLTFSDGSRISFTTSKN